MAAAVLLASLSAAAMCSARAVEASTALPDTAHTAPAAQRARWGLVLSGGVARGLAHIGVLRALEEQHLRPDIVVGTSMGAVIGSLYASGYSSGQIAERVRGIDWTHLFFQETDALAWRGNSAPHPLLQLGLSLRGIQFPSAPFSDAELNYLLSDLLIDGSGAAASFDQLPIPFRAVATDVATVSPVVLGKGSLARAVRASMSIPLVLAPVRAEGRLLVDGGVADNLPVATARELGADRVVAVDVAAELGTLDSLASAPAAALYLLRFLLQRHPSGTAGPSDLSIKLKLPGYTIVDFSASDSLVALGYRGSVDAIRAYADSVGLPRTPARLASPPPPTLPPLAQGVEWNGLRTLSPHAARAALGRLPRGAFQPTALRPALGRLYRTSLFESAWPSLEARGDSTVLRFDVREQLRRELTLAAAYGTDEGARAYARLALRAPWMPAIALGEVTGIQRRYGRALLANVEPHALGRGGSGPFLRAEYRDSETRLFGHGRLQSDPKTIRREVFAGAQLELPARQIAQFGVGIAGVDEVGRQWDGAIFVVRTESRSSARRLIEAEWMPGAGGYSRISGWFDAARKLGVFTARPSLRLAAVSGDTPMDALVGLGGPLTLGGLHDDEWLGRRSAAAEFRLQYPVGVALTLSAAGQLGVVDGAIGAAEIPARLRPAASVGVDLATLFGPMRADWGSDAKGRARGDVMLGHRF